MPQDENLLLLGEIKGKLDLVIDSQVEDRKIRSEERNEIITRIDGIDDRLRKVEIKAATTGAITGGLVAIGFELAKAKISTFLGGN